MKMRTVIYLLTVFAAGAVLVPAQDQTPERAGKAIVYVYSYNVSALGTVRKTVYLNGKALADVTPGRYFISVIEPGKHEIHWKDKKRGGTLAEFEQGKTYYLRAGWNEGGITIKTAGLDLVAPDNGAFDIKQLRPVEAKNIKDPIRARRQL